MLIHCSFKQSYSQLVAKTTLSGKIAIEYDVCRATLCLFERNRGRSIRGGEKDQHPNTYVPKASESSVHQVIMAHI